MQGASVKSFLSTIFVEIKKKEEEESFHSLRKHSNVYVDRSRVRNVHKLK